MAIAGVGSGRNRGEDEAKVRKSGLVASVARVCPSSYFV
jgi:hypothetical protein